MDELSAVTPNQVWYVHEGAVEYADVDAVKDLGLAPATVNDLLGGDAAFNAEVAKRVLAGEPGPVRDAVALNAAGAFVAEGTRAGMRASNGSIIERLAAGLDVACNTIDSGAAEDLLHRWVKFSEDAQPSEAK
jgi:anthranilate phosphoribosyltransferase